MSQPPTAPANSHRREYAGLATSYDRRWAGYIRATVVRTLEGVEVAPGAAALDVGCGTGALLAELDRRQPRARLAGIDPVPEMLAVARRRLPEACDLREGCAERLPWDVAAFDLVVSANALHYMDDPEAAIREMARVVRPGGHLILTDWCADSLSIRLLERWLRHTGRPAHQILTASRLRGLAETAGFRVTGLDRYRVGWLYGMMTLRAVRGEAEPPREGEAPSEPEREPSLHRS